MDEPKEILESEDAKNNLVTFSHPVLRFAKGIKVTNNIDEANNLLLTHKWIVILAIKRLDSLEYTLIEI